MVETFLINSLVQYFRLTEIPASRIFEKKGRYYLDSVNLCYITKDVKLREGPTQLVPKVARHCFISRRFSLRLAPYVFLASLHSVCSVPPFSFPDALPSLVPRVHLRPSDTNGQSKLRHYEVPGAEVTPRYGATHHFGIAATIHGRETPLGLSRRERDPYSVCPNAQPAQKGTGRELIRPT